MTRIPTPRVWAEVNDSTSPSRVRTWARRVSWAYASTCSPALAASPAARHRASRSATGPPHGHPGDAERRAAVRHRRALALLAAHPVSDVDVVGHRVDGGQDRRAVADE